MPVPTSGFPSMSPSGALSCLGFFLAGWGVGCPDPHSWTRTHLWLYWWRSPPAEPRRQLTSPPAQSSARPASGSARPAGWWPPSACPAPPPDACTELRKGNTGIHPPGGAVPNTPRQAFQSDPSKLGSPEKKKSFS